MKGYTDLEEKPGASYLAYGSSVLASLTQTNNKTGMMANPWLELVVNNTSHHLPILGVQSAAYDALQGWDDGGQWRIG